MWSWYWGNKHGTLGLKTKGSTKESLFENPIKCLGALSCSTWHFLAILESMVEDVDGTTIHMRTSNIRVKCLDLRQQLYGRKPIDMGRKAIVDPDGIQHGKRSIINQGTLRSAN